MKTKTSPRWFFLVGLLLIVLVGGAARMVAKQVVERRLAEKNAKPAPAASLVFGEAPTHDMSSDPRFLFPDSEDFHAYALSLVRPDPADVASGNDAPRDAQGRQAWRTPLYSWLLSLWYRVAGDEVASARWLNILLDLLGIAVAGLAARRLAIWLDWSAPASAGLAAALFYALDPWGALFSTLILAETSASVLTLLSAWLAMEWMCRRQLTAGADWKAALCGVAAGLACGGATLAKPSLGLLVAGYAFFAVFGRWRRVRRDEAPPLPRPSGWRKIVAGSAGWLALGFVLAMMPWWTWTAKRFTPEFVPLSTMGGFTWWETVGPEADGGANFGKTPFPLRWLMLREALAKDVWRDQPQRAPAADPSAETKPYYAVYRQRYVWRRHEGDSAANAGYIAVSLMLPQGRSLTLTGDELAHDLGPVHAMGGWIKADWDRENVGRAEAAGRFEWKADETLRTELPNALKASGSADASAKILRHAPKKLARLWNPFPNWSGAASWGSWVKWVSALSFGVVVVLALAAMRTTRGAWRLAWWFMVPAAYLTLVHMVVLASVRYRLPAWGGLCVLAGLGASILWDALRRRREN